jgi:predicted nucleic acid-binding protein
VRFWDSSAIVPLVVRQGGSAEAERWLADEAALVTWTLTPVEIVSALRCLVREGDLPERSASRAESLADTLLERTHVVADVGRAAARSRSGVGGRPSARPPDPHLRPAARDGGGARGLRRASRGVKPC